MKDITWELKNLDSLKFYIFNDLIGEHENYKDINESINTYAERYHEMKLILLGNQREQDLHHYNKWLMEVWIPNLYIPFAIDAPRAYLKYRKEQLIIADVVKSLPQDNFCEVCNLPTDGEKCYSRRCPV